MEIELLYVRDCPNREIARNVVDLALARTQLTAIVRQREVHSSAEAQRLGMRGSPTILIDGDDPFAAGPNPAGMACRLYPGDAGFGGAPTLGQVVEALGG
jgi:hypothetical protein